MERHKASSCETVWPAVRKTPNQASAPAKSRTFVHAMTTAPMASAPGRAPTQTASVRILLAARGSPGRGRTPPPARAQIGPKQVEFGPDLDSIRAELETCKYARSRPMQAEFGSSSAQIRRARIRSGKNWPACLKFGRDTTDVGRARPKAGRNKGWGFPWTHTQVLPNLGVRHSSWNLGLPDLTNPENGMHPWEAIKWRTRTIWRPLRRGLEGILRALRSARVDA